MAEIAFRDALPADKEAVLAVVSAAFGIPHGSERWHHLEQDFSAPNRNWRVSEENGNVTGALCVTSSRLRVGDGYLLKGDVGEVAVVPTRQGAGIGSALMRDTVAWMREQGYDFSRLGGLVRFYSRFGYVPFTRRYVEFYLRSGVGAGAATVHPAYLREPAESHVFALSGEQERQRCRELDIACNGWRTGALVASGAVPGGNVLVYKAGDRVLAWLQLNEFPIDRTEFESRLTIGGGAYETGRADALAALVAHVLRMAHSRGYDHVSARLPFDPELFAALTASSLPYKAVELHEAEAATMVQVLNARSLFAHLLPELKRRWRLAEVPVDKAITFEIGGQVVTLALCPGAMAITDEPGDETVSLSHSAVLTMALGLHAPSYVLRQSARQLHPQVMALLGILFPEQLATSGTWG